jgi:hypothetical protein
MTTISMRFPVDVLDDLKRVAPLLGFSGYQPLIRAYVDQGSALGLEVLVECRGAYVDASDPHRAS